MAELLTVPELSDELKVPIPTIYKWRATGLGPRGIRVGKHVRFRREDVEAWLEQQADEQQPRHAV